jgi:predicted RNA-binding Zn ribbon-like protein
MKTPEYRKMTEIRLDGGRLCLDFTNTIHDRSSPQPEDYIRDIGDLLDWLALTKSLPRELVERMRRSAVATPRHAGKVFMAAIAFREVLYRVFSSIAGGDEIRTKDLLSLNAYIGDTMRNSRLQREGKKIVTTWDYRKGGLEKTLWPIVKSALDLLLEGNFDRIKRCPRCHWLFNDTSKNGRRRWCSMDTCGGIDKSLRYYYRQKSQKG